MSRFLSRIFGAGAKGGIRGFVFASLARDDEMVHAEPGRIVRNATAGRPWIVVARGIESVLGAGWPGRLWEVEVLEAASDQPREGAGYTRAVAVRVVRELPPSILFGEHGDDVLRVIEKAAVLEPDEAVELGARSAGAAREAYARAWEAWLAKVEPGNFHRGSDHGDTLAVFAGGTRSPIGIGLTVLHDVLTRRAREVAGEAAFTTDEEEGEMYLSSPWSEASGPLLQAAMAFGAPELVSDPDRRAMLDAWERCFGRE